ncbi:AraC family transcriptional regulator [uncultured Lutibacter sp.]|uniref:helix-turn-helix domain-containing protein n=1 Tax=uncultured Lutibacter sp. TaxID=437739 RepID=UPI00262A04C5|nr:AraC family transcriptional regulator [uncultured Lutibacter sp.]
MRLENFTIAIKNMVCDRCIKVITEELRKNNLKFICVKLGEIHFKNTLTEHELTILKILLKKEGFEIVETFEAKIINQIKTVIIENIHHKKHQLLNQNYSAFLASKIGLNYSQLSKIFSDLEKNTIEKYIILQKIERVKELLVYNELTLSQISYDLNYSSPQHLSRQFKKVTGLTPTEYKKQSSRKKLDTI